MVKMTSLKDETFGDAAIMNHKKEQRVRSTRDSVRNKEAGEQMTVDIYKLTQDIVKASHGKSRKKAISRYGGPSRAAVEIAMASVSTNSTASSGESVAGRDRYEQRPEVSQRPNSMGRPAAPLRASLYTSIKEDEENGESRDPSPTCIRSHPSEVTFSAKSTCTSTVSSLGGCSKLRQEQDKYHVYQQYSEDVSVQPISKSTGVNAELREVSQPVEMPSIDEVSRREEAGIEKEWYSLSEKKTEQKDRGQVKKIQGSDSQEEQAGGKVQETPVSLDEPNRRQRNGVNVDDILVKGSSPDYQSRDKYCPGDVEATQGETEDKPPLERKKYLATAAEKLLQSRKKFKYIKQEKIPGLAHAVIPKSSIDFNLGEHHSLIASNDWLGGFMNVSSFLVGEVKHMVKSESESRPVVAPEFSREPKLELPHSDDQSSNNQSGMFEKKKCSPGESIDRVESDSVEKYLEEASQTIAESTHAGEIRPLRKVHGIERIKVSNKNETKYPIRDSGYHIQGSKNDTSLLGTSVVSAPEKTKRIKKIDTTDSNACSHNTHTPFSVLVSENEYVDVVPSGEGVVAESHESHEFDQSEPGKRRISLKSFNDLKSQLTDKLERNSTSSQSGKPEPLCSLSDSSSGVGAQFGPMHQEVSDNRHAAGANVTKKLQNTSFPGESRSSVDDSTRDGRLDGVLSDLEINAIRELLGSPSAGRFWQSEYKTKNNVAGNQSRIARLGLAHRRQRERVSAVSTVGIVSSPRSNFEAVLEYVDRMTSPAFPDEKAFAPCNENEKRRLLATLRDSDCVKRKERGEGECGEVNEDKSERKSDKPARDLNFRLAQKEAINSSTTDETDIENINVSDEYSTAHVHGSPLADMRSESPYSHLEYSRDGSGKASDHQSKISWGAHSRISRFSDALSQKSSLTSSSRRSFPSLIFNSGDIELVYKRKDTKNSSLSLEPSESQKSNHDYHETGTTDSSLWTGITQTSERSVKKMEYVQGDSQLHQQGNSGILGSADLESRSDRPIAGRVSPKLHCLSEGFVHLSPSSAKSEYTFRGSYIRSESTQNDAFSSTTEESSRKSFPSTLLQGQNSTNGTRRSQDSRERLNVIGNERRVMVGRQRTYDKDVNLNQSRGPRSIDFDYTGRARDQSRPPDLGEAKKTFSLPSDPSTSTAHFNAWDSFIVAEDSNSVQEDMGYLEDLESTASNDEGCGVFARGRILRSADQIIDLEPEDRTLEESTSYIIKSGQFQMQGNQDESESRILSTHTLDITRNEDSNSVQEALDYLEDLQSTASNDEGRGSFARGRILRSADQIIDIEPEDRMLEERTSYIIDSGQFQLQGNQDESESKILSNHTLDIAKDENECLRVNVLKTRAAPTSVEPTAMTGSIDTLVNDLESITMTSTEKVDPFLFWEKPFSGSSNFDRLEGAGEGNPFGIFMNNQKWESNENDSIQVHESKEPPGLSSCSAPKLSLGYVSEGVKLLPAAMSSATKITSTISEEVEMSEKAESILIGFDAARVNTYFQGSDLGAGTTNHDDAGRSKFGFEIPQNNINDVVVGNPAMSHSVSDDVCRKVCQSLLKPGMPDGHDQAGELLVTIESTTMEEARSALKINPDSVELKTSDGPGLDEESELVGDDSETGNGEAYRNSSEKVLNPDEIKDQHSNVDDGVDLIQDVSSNEVASLSSRSLVFAGEYDLSLATHDNNTVGTNDTDVSMPIRHMVGQRTHLSPLQAFFRRIMCGACGVCESNDGESVFEGRGENQLIVRTLQSRRHIRMEMVSSGSIHSYSYSLLSFEEDTKDQSNETRQSVVAWKSERKYIDNEGYFDVSAAMIPSTRYSGVALTMTEAMEEDSRAHLPGATSPEGLDGIEAESLNESHKYLHDSDIPSHRMVSQEHHSDSSPVTTLRQSDLQDHTQALMVSAGIPFQSEGNGLDVEENLQYDVSNIGGATLHAAPSEPRNESMKEPSSRLETLESGDRVSLHQKDSFETGASILGLFKHGDDDEAIGDLFLRLGLSADASDSLESSMKRIPGSPATGDITTLIEPIRSDTEASSLAPSLEDSEIDALLEDLFSENEIIIPSVSFRADSKIASTPNSSVDFLLFSQEEIAESIRSEIDNTTSGNTPCLYQITNQDEAPQESKKCETSLDFHYGGSCSETFSLSRIQHLEQSVPVDVSTGPSENDGLQLASAMTHTSSIGRNEVVVTAVKDPLPCFTASTDASREETMSCLVGDIEALKASMVSGQVPLHSLDCDTCIIGKSKTTDGDDIILPMTARSSKVEEAFMFICDNPSDQANSKDRTKSMGFASTFDSFDMTQNCMMSQKSDLSSFIKNQGAPANMDEKEKSKLLVETSPFSNDLDYDTCSKKQRTMSSTAEVESNAPAFDASLERAKYHSEDVHESVEDCRSSTEKSACEYRGTEATPNQLASNAEKLETVPSRNDDEMPEEGCLRSSSDDSGNEVTQAIENILVLNSVKELEKMLNGDYDEDEIEGDGEQGDDFLQTFLLVESTSDGDTGKEYVNDENQTGEPGTFDEIEAFLTTGSQSEEEEQ